MWPLLSMTTSSTLAKVLLPLRRTFEPMRLLIRRVSVTVVPAGVTVVVVVVGWASASPGPSRARPQASPLSLIMGDTPPGIGQPPPRDGDPCHTSGNPRAKEGV